ncbi:hypothetical protein EG834_05335, partial [bacterium]|nr:hypothetical protein [bacterium]
MNPMKPLIPLLILVFLAFLMPASSPVLALEGDDFMFTLSAEWTDDGEFSGVDYGVSVASAGDINGDGFADVIVGAQKCLIDDERCGAAFVYLGGGGGLTS